MTVNLTCYLPDGCIGVTLWDIHPCDGKVWMREAWCYGPNGRIGQWLEDSVTGLGPGPIGASR